MPRRPSVIMWCKQGCIEDHNNGLFGQWLFTMKTIAIHLSPTVSLLTFDHSIVQKCHHGQGLLHWVWALSQVTCRLVHCSAHAFVRNMWVQGVLSTGNLSSRRVLRRIFKSLDSRKFNYELFEIEKKLIRTIGCVDGHLILSMILSSRGCCVTIERRRDILN